MEARRVRARPPSNFKKKTQKGEQIPSFFFSGKRTVGFEKESLETLLTNETRAPDGRSTQKMHFLRDTLRHLLLRGELLCCTRKEADRGARASRKVILWAKRNFRKPPPQKKKNNHVFTSSGHPIFLHAVTVVKMLCSSYRLTAAFFRCNPSSFAPGNLYIISLIANINSSSRTLSVVTGGAFGFFEVFRTFSISPPPPFFECMHLWLRPHLFQLRLLTTPRKTPSPPPST